MNVNDYLCFQVHKEKHDFVETITRLFKNLNDASVKNLIIEK